MRFIFKERRRREHLLIEQRDVAMTLNTLKTLEERLHDALMIKTKMRDLGFDIRDETWTRDLNEFIRDGRSVSGRVFVDTAQRYVDYSWIATSGKESVIRLRCPPLRRR